MAASFLPAPHAAVPGGHGPHAYHVPYRSQSHPLAAELRELLATNVVYRGPVEKPHHRLDQCRPTG